jgi:tetratricopeptide (TPR) repeat protein
MAGKDLDEAIKNKALDYKNIGNDYFKKGNYKNAIKSYKDALHLDSTNPDIWNNLGFAYLKIGKFKEAKKCQEVMASLKEK